MLRWQACWRCHFDDNPVVSLFGGMSMGMQAYSQPVGWELVGMTIIQHGYACACCQRYKKEVKRSGGTLIAALSPSLIRVHRETVELRIDALPAGKINFDRSHDLSFPLSTKA